MKKQKQPKVNPLTVSVAQAFAHQHSATVQRQRRVHEFELQETEGAITVLTSALAGQRQKHRDLRARIEGLTLVIERR